MVRSPLKIDPYWDFSGQIKIKQIHLGSLTVLCDSGPQYSIPLYYSAFKSDTVRDKRKKKFPECSTKHLLLSALSNPLGKLKIHP